MNTLYSNINYKSVKFNAQFIKILMISKNLFNNYMDFKNYTCIIKKKIPPANFRTLVIFCQYQNIFWSGFTAKLTLSIWITDPHIQFCQMYTP